MLGPPRLSFPELPRLRTGPWCWWYGTYEELGTYEVVGTYGDSYGENFFEGIGSTLFGIKGMGGK